MPAKNLILIALIHILRCLHSTPLIQRYEQCSIQHPDQELSCTEGLVCTKEGICDYYITEKLTVSEKTISYTNLTYDDYQHFDGEFDPLVKPKTLDGKDESTTSIALKNDKESNLTYKNHQELDGDFDSFVKTHDGDDESTSNKALRRDEKSTTDNGLRDDKESTTDKELTKIDDDGDDESTTSKALSNDKEPTTDNESRDDKQSTNDEELSRNYKEVPPEGIQTKTPLYEPTNKELTTKTESTTVEGLKYDKESIKGELKSDEESTSGKELGNDQKLTTNDQALITDEELRINKQSTTVNKLKNDESKTNEYVEESLNDVELSDEKFTTDISLPKNKESLTEKLRSYKKTDLTYDDYLELGEELNPFEKPKIQEDKEPTTSTVLNGEESNLTHDDYRKLNGDFDSFVKTHDESTTSKTLRSDEESRSDNELRDDKESTTDKELSKIDDESTTSKALRSDEESTTDELSKINKKVIDDDDLTYYDYLELTAEENTEAQVLIDPRYAQCGSAQTPPCAAGLICIAGSCDVEMKLDQTKQTLDISAYLPTVTYPKANLKQKGENCSNSYELWWCQPPLVCSRDICTDGASNQQKATLNEFRSEGEECSDTTEGWRCQPPLVCYLSYCEEPIVVIRQGFMLHSYSPLYVKQVGDNCSASERCAWNLVCNGGVCSKKSALVKATKSPYSFDLKLKQKGQYCSNSIELWWCKPPLVCSDITCRESPDYEDRDVIFKLEGEECSNYLQDWRCNPPLVCYIFICTQPTDVMIHSLITQSYSPLGTFKLQGENCSNSECAWPLVCHGGICNRPSNTSKISTTTKGPPSPLDSRLLPILREGQRCSNSEGFLRCKSPLVCYNQLCVGNRFLMMVSDNSPLSRSFDVTFMQKGDTCSNFIVNKRCSFPLICLRQICRDPIQNRYPLIASNKQLMQKDQDCAAFTMNAMRCEPPLICFKGSCVNPMDITLDDRYTPEINVLTRGSNCSGSTRYEGCLATMVCVQGVCSLGFSPTYEEEGSPLTTTLDNFAETFEKQMESYCSHIFNGIFSVIDAIKYKLQFKRKTTTTKDYN